MVGNPGLYPSCHPPKSILTYNLSIIYYCIHIFEELRRKVPNPKLKMGNSLKAQKSNKKTTLYPVQNKKKINHMKVWIFLKGSMYFQDQRSNSRFSITFKKTVPKFRVYGFVHV